MGMIFKNKNKMILLFPPGGILLAYFRLLLFITWVLEVD